MVPNKSSKKGEASAIMSKRYKGLPPIDQWRPEWHLWVLCKHGHEFEQTGQSVRNSSGDCILCDRARNVRWYQRKKIDDAIARS
jgi:hypothetical protein